MNPYDMIFTMVQTTDPSVPNLFPFPFNFHLIFSIAAVAFFLYRFVVQKKPFQLIFALAIPFSMLIWLSERKNLFYTIGTIELLLIIAALISTIVYKPEKAAEASGETADTSTADDEEEETAPAADEEAAEEDDEEE